MPASQAPQAINKYYIALFTCASSRALHFELVYRILRPICSCNYSIDLSDVEVFQTLVSDDRKALHDAISAAINAKDYKLEICVK